MTPFDFNAARARALDLIRGHVTTAANGGSEFDLAWAGGQISLAGCCGLITGSEEQAFHQAIRNSGKDAATTEGARTRPMPA